MSLLKSLHVLRWHGTKPVAPYSGNYACSIEWEVAVDFS